MRKDRPPRKFIEREIVYLRLQDEGTDNACWVICAKGDKGAVAFVEIGGDEYE